MTIVGLSATLHLLERFSKQLDITLKADKFPPNTVSDRAVGVFLYADTIIDGGRVLPQTRQWLSATLDRVGSIFCGPDNASVGVSLSQGYLLFDSSQPDPWWKDLMFGFRRVKLDSAEAKVLQIPPDCAEIFSFSTYILEPIKYMGWMLERIRSNGCKVIQTSISNFDELISTYDVVINCTGMNSCQLVPDSELYPIRGQGAIVKAPWLKHWVAFLKSDRITYVFPRAFSVVLGGTAEVGNWSETEDEDVIEDIVDHCQALVPSLIGAETVSNYVGLRPGRDAIRLDSNTDDKCSLT